MMCLVFVYNTNRFVSVLSCRSLNQHCENPAILCFGKYSCSFVPAADITASELNKHSLGTLNADKNTVERLGYPINSWL